ncbi:MAG TPA: hypothetical protein VKQ72_18005 [Aggregatilineales bacterium]|nr:hypothetical protein [Aggregatilineales bacterium]
MFGWKVLRSSIRYSVAVLALLFAVGLSLPAAGARTLLDNAPVAFKNPLLYVGANGNVYMTDEFSGQGAAVTGDSQNPNPGKPNSQFAATLFYGQFAWSPAGDAFAYTERTTKSIFAVQNGQKPLLLYKGADMLPPAFSPDGKNVAYVVMTPQKSGDSATIFQIQNVPTAGGNPSALGSLAIGTACGGDMFDPAEGAYFQEIGVLGPGPMFFNWTKLGYLYSMNCDGTGLALSDGSKVIWQQANLQNPAISPDGTQAVAVLADPVKKTKEIDLVDLATGKLTSLTAPQDLDKAIWSNDGKSIIFDTQSAGATVQGNASSAVGKQIMDTLWPLQGQDNGIVIATIPVAGGTTTAIYKDTGRGIGNMSAARNKPYIAFSLVSSSGNFVLKINNGASLDQAAAQYPHSRLLTTTLDGTAVGGLVSDPGGRPDFGPTDQFSIIPAQASAPIVPTLVVPGGSGGIPTLVPAGGSPLPTATPIPNQVLVGGDGGLCPNFSLALRLHVGGQGRVLPGQSNRIRSSAPSGTILTLMPQGSIFNVIGGPLCSTDGTSGIAWWDVNFNGTTGWTAEGFGGTYWLEPYTGAPPPPAGGTFGIVGVTAAVSPASGSSCPMTFHFTGQIVVNVPGQVMYHWERSDGATGPTLGITYPAGVTTVDVQDTWTLSGNYSGWERIHVTSPNDITSNQASFSLSCGSAFQVTGAGASVSGPGGCPTGTRTYNFSGNITANGAGTVTYKWERSDGASSSSLSTLIFGGPGTQNVPSGESWQLGASGTFWERIHVISPNSLYSNQATFTKC